MHWQEHAAAFLAVANALPDLVGRVPDFTEPGLGVWDLAGLAGHLLRAVRLPVQLLARPEPPGAPLPDAAAYYLRYLERRDADPDGVDGAVADRGSHELAGIDPEAFPRVFATAAASAAAALQGIPGSRKVATPYGPMRIQDYLRTRILEATVHGLDLARAAHLSWAPPEEAVADTLDLLVTVARERGQASALLLALTGRAVPAGEALPILR